jgi:hypothetical protein
MNVFKVDSFPVLVVLAREFYFLVTLSSLIYLSNSFLVHPQPLSICLKLFLVDLALD